MFSGLFKLVRSFFKMWGGMFTSAANKMHENEYVMADTYDNSIEKGRQQYQKTKEIAGNVIGRQEKKRQDLIKLTGEIEHLEKVKSGAASMAKNLAAKLKAEGKSEAEIKEHVDIKKCLAGFNDATSTLKEKNTRADQIEKDIADLEKTAANIKAQLQTIQRTNEKLQNEKSEAIGDVLSAKESDEMADLINGMSVTGVDKDLEAARTARRNMTARAKVSSELAGNDARAAESEFLQFAQDTEATSEFDALIGLGNEATAETPLAPAKLAD